MSEPHERLNEAMNRRRLDLRMNWREVSTAAGVSYEALRSIRRGDYRPSEITARALDDALQWPHGTVEAVLEGAPPPATPRETAAEILAETQGIADEVMEMLERRGLGQAQRQRRALEAAARSLEEMAAAFEADQDAS